MIMNQIEFHLVHIRKGWYDDILFQFESKLKYNSLSLLPLSFTFQYQNTAIANNLNSNLFYLLYVNSYETLVRNSASSDNHAQQISSGHSEKQISAFFHIDMDIIVMKTFYLVFNQMEIRFVQTHMHPSTVDHIPSNLKGS